MIGPKSKRNLKAAKDRIAELKATIESLKEQRDKIRSTRDELRFKLEDANQTVVDYQKLSEPYWKEDLERTSLGKVPGEKLISHIAHRRDSETPSPENLVLSGRFAANRINEVICEQFQEENPLSILDFGCGFGRVTQFLGGPNRTVSGCDIDIDAITWARDHLTSIGKFQVTNDSPPLPKALKGFDVILALSIFTHLPEDLQIDWLRELHSRMNPNGLLIATIHGESFYRFIPESEESTFRESGFLHINLGQTPDLPEYYLTAFHSHDYVRSKWAEAGFEILSIEEQALPQASVRQDLVVARKR